MTADQWLPGKDGPKGSRGTMEIFCIFIVAVVLQMCITVELIGMCTLFFFFRIKLCSNLIFLELTLLCSLFSIYESILFLLFILSVKLYH